jgi:hypothetical protein
MVAIPGPVPGRVITKIHLTDEHGRKPLSMLITAMHDLDAYRPSSPRGPRDGRTAQDRARRAVGAAPAGRVTGSAADDCLG